MIKISAAGELLLRQAIHYIEENPQEWDQCTYINNCGTTTCLAGWISALKMGTSIQGLREEYDAGNFSPSNVALDALGITNYVDRDHFRSLVFYYCEDIPGGITLRGEKENVAFLKKRLTEVTGLEF